MHSQTQRTEQYHWKLWGTVEHCGECATSERDKEREEALVYVMAAHATAVYSSAHFMSFSDEVH